MSGAGPIPGFVDLQVNGYRGVDFTSPELEAEALAGACRELLHHGTAAFLPCVITCAMETYRRNLPLISACLGRPEFEGRLLGIHLEGPFISRAAGAVGAHAPQWVLPPDPGLLERFQQWAGGRIRLLTVAADAAGAEELVRCAVRMGITVALGHHMAGEADLERMACAGATLLTHLGNGAPALVPRHSNPIWAGLACDLLAATIITDGHHLPASAIKVMCRAKGARRLAVISDASPVSGLAPGRYRVAGNDAQVVLEPSGRLHNPDLGCLAGSSATMLECMNHLAGLGFLGREELEAVGFHNPLRFIGLGPAAVRGPRQIDYDPAARRFSLTRA